MVWSIYPYDNEFVSVENININGIPSLKFKPKETKGLFPTVVYYHGWHSNKDFQRFKAFTLACNGFQVIVPDAIYHGERNPVNHDDPKVLDDYFWKVIIQTVEESEEFIKEVISNHNADPNGIGVIGSSMGGFSASGVFALNENIKTLIVFNGSCAWVKADEIFRRMENAPPADSKEIKILSQHDPMSHLDNLLLRPILIMHGDNDTSVPIDSQRYFHETVRPLYSDKSEKLKLIEIQNLNHSITTGMLEQATIWLKENL